MTTPLQITRYDRLARRLMGLVGEGAIVTSVLPDVFPVIDVESLETDGWAIAGWRPAVGFESQNAVPAANSQVHFVNLNNTGLLAVLEEIWITSNTLANIELGYNTILATIPGATNGLRTFRDRRIPTGLPGIQITESSGLGFAPSMRITILANVPFVVAPPKGMSVFPPGTMMTVHSSTVNTTLTVTYIWRERLMEPAETTL